MQHKGEKIMGIIVGYEKEKREIENIRDMLISANRYREYGVRIPRGLALYGEPGVGKTVLAKSIAGDGVNLIELRAANCCEEDATKEIKSVFDRAKRSAPAVLLLDELDKIAGTNDRFFMEMNDSVKKTLLQELDSLTEDDTVLVVATCNDTEVLGDALLRPGRFDRQLHIEAPDEATRKQILTEYFSYLKVKKQLDFGYIARITHGYTGAQLECLANETGIMAMRKEKPSIDISDVRIIMNRFSFGGEEKNPTENREELRKIAVHEAGHALAATLLAPDCIYGASILPQGNSCGHIQFIKPEDGVGSVKEIENEVAVLLAGHVAERVIYGETFCGSCSDLNKAASRIHFLATQCAAYGYNSAASLIHMRYHNDIVSESVKTEICRTIEEKMNLFDSLAEKLIKENVKTFMNLVDKLIEKQTLSREELFEIINASAKQAKAA